jgi:hypothetical protein
MLASTINLTIFIMMIIIYLNELKNVSLFVFNFNYIKDLSKIIMEQKCNNIYCEAETDRYQIAKNSYKLLLPNDIFNSKTYTIMVFIISIMIYIYYYYQLFDNDESDKYYYFLLLHFILLAMLISMIILRYVPHDEAGYQNYFRDFDDPNNTFATFITFFKYFIWVFIFLIIPGIIYFIKKSDLKTTKMTLVLLIKAACYIFSIVLIFNLMNIVMTFRTNTKPILKTKNLSWSLQKTYTQLYEEYTGSERAELETEISAQYNIFIYIKDNMGTFTRETVKLNDKEITSTKDNPSTKEHIISYIINIFIAFDELAKITLKKLSIDESYKTSLINIINENNAKLLEDTLVRKMNTNVSNVSLIYDKTVKIPYTYGTNDSNTVGEHNTNGNENNTDYIYTADISYDSPNLFYEKYWDINDVSFWKQDYFVPTILFTSRPNLYKILTMIIGFIICFIIIYIITSFISEEIQFNSILNILKPLIMFVILMIFILFFISFNTWFNKYVVYMCLDSSYKRSLNKLNNIVIPYIRMYDNKIIKGNKTYIRHYIIANVFYSILSGNIKLNDGASVSSSTAASEAAAQTKIKDAYNAAKIVNDDIFKLRTDLKTVIDNNDYASSKTQANNISVITLTTSATSAQTKAEGIYNNARIIALKKALDDLNIKIQNIDIKGIDFSNIDSKIAAISIIVNDAILTSSPTTGGQNGKVTTAINAFTGEYLMEITKELRDIVNNATKSVNDLKTQIDNINSNSYSYDMKNNIISKYVEYTKREVLNAKDIMDSTYSVQYASVTSATKLNDLIKGDVTTSITAIKTAENLASIDTIKAAATAAFKNVIKAKNLSDTALKNAESARDVAIKLIPSHSSLEPINDQEEENSKYYDIQRIKTGRLKFANMNNSILSNDNEFREYYKALYKNIYNETYDEARANKLYRVFKDIFTNPSSAITDDAKIEDYFKTNIITNNPDTGTVSKIYFIIKKCIELFDEEKFNNNLIYYNNPDNKQKGIDINSYNKFKFYKYGDNVIPYKFILKLNTKSEYDDFVKDIITTANTTLNNIITVDFGIQNPADITPILEDNSEEDLLSQASDIEKKQDKNLIKIIAKYLLILGHINYNRIEYNDASSDPEKKKDIYERKSYYLYKLISNILYNDTYDINDTFQITTAPDLVIKNSKYYNLTYIYNYLETKYVVISPNINKNYLINIIKSINNKINDDDKTLNSEVKNARYLFRDKIDNKNNPEEYDNEEDILNIANSISTISFGATYIFNIVLMTVYFYIISLHVKKSF